VKEYSISYPDFRIDLKVRGGYIRSIPPYELLLIITIENNSKASIIDINMNNIDLILNHNHLKWNNPREDSLYSKFDKKKTTIYKTFLKPTLTEEDKTFIKNNKFPLKFVLNNVVFVNENALKIDTIYATSPKISYSQTGSSGP
jgi:hypothetical protein